MQRPLEISFHQMDPSPAIEARIREKAAVLERFSDRITGCRVVVEKDHHHHHKGNLFRVRVMIAAPGKEIAINRAGPRDHAHEDVYVAIRDAFDAAVRRLEDHVRVQRGKVKLHAGPTTGRIKRLFELEDYGFIATDQGEEVYFHANAVQGGGFKDLREGQEVRLTIDEREGIEGWQATSVQPLAGRRPAG